MTDSDREQLGYLAIAHYVLAGLAFLFGSFPIIHFLAGAFLTFGPVANQPGSEGVPRLVGGIFMALGGTLVAIAYTVAGLIAFAGRSLQQQRRHTFCVVMAVAEAVSCVPLGTILGVLTLIVLLRPSTKAVFGLPPAA